MLNSEKDKEVVSAEQITEQLQTIRDNLEQIARKLARGSKSLYFVGDNGPTGELKKVIARALKVKGWTLQELSDITGARRNRISGVIVKLQKDGEKVVNDGDGYRAIWRIR